MNIFSALQFSLAALNFGVMAWSISRGSDLWWLNLSVGVFCLLMGFVQMKK